MIVGELTRSEQMAPGRDSRAQGSISCRAARLSLCASILHARFGGAKQAQLLLSRLSLHLLGNSEVQDPFRRLGLHPHPFSNK